MNEGKQANYVKKNVVKKTQHGNEGKKYPLQQSNMNHLTVK